MIPLNEIRALFHYNPLTGEFTFLQQRGPKSPGEPAGGNVDGRRCLFINGKHYKAAPIAWALHYGSDPSPQHVTFLDGNPLNLAIANLALSDQPFTRPRGNRGHSMKRPTWYRSIKYSGRRQCWRVHHHGRLLGEFDTKALAIQAKRYAISEDNA